MGYQSVVGRIRTDTETQVMRAWEQYGKGYITKPQFVQIAAALIGQGSARAAVTADLALSAELTRLTRTVQPTTGRLPKGYGPDAFAAGIQTIIDGPEGDIAMRLERLALNGPLDAANANYSNAVSAAEPVEGWVRQMDADPCQLCRWWWREGRVWPKDHAMQHHKGCTCTQRVTLKETKK